MAQFEINNLSQISNEDILACFNTAFSDYSIPFRLNMTQLETKLYSESIDKSISVGAFMGKKLIGFILHGKRMVHGVQVAYNAGTGVIPQERGHGLTKRMYDYAKPILTQNGFDHVLLEVITTNDKAIWVYKRIGFKELRCLSCFKGDPLVTTINKAVKIQEVSQLNFSEFAVFGEIKPTWQNSNDTILLLKNDVCFFLGYLEGKICGYGIVNSKSNRILQLAVKKECRNELIGSSLLKYFKSNFSGPMSIINVDDNYKSTLDFFTNRNMKKTISQFEMKLTL